MSAKNEAIKKLLMDLESKTQGVEASAIISNQGLPIAFAMPPEIDEAVIAAMSASILGVSERTLEELTRGTLSKVMIEGTEGSFIIMDAGANALLTVLVKKKSNLGLIFLVMQRTSKRIRTILEG
ncbi:MAG: roadblock/LC7 domain-containing protein [Candidatus Ranarchaeia archaeon]|jgi:predicted regulator of Ras-like GTPase activity (Roadblock/LC7/MglB family)